MMTRCLAWAALVVWGTAIQQADASEPAASGDVRWRDVPHTDTVFKPTKYASLAEWKQRREWLVDQVRFAAGLYPEPERTPLKARIFGRLDRDGYTIEKVHFESVPGFYVTGNLYRPRGVKGNVPAVACPHGHWPKGRLNHDERGSVPARCITLARLGAVVFSYDMIGYNDSKRQIDHRDKQLNSPRSSLWGLSSLAMQTWNSVRVLDFLQSLEGVDPERIGVTGASGGGTQTFILSGIDDRVKVAAPVNMISSTMQGGCLCENAPLLRIETNNMEIGALFAPKPLLLVSATGDWTKNTPTVEYPMIRGIYELYGAAERVANVHVDAPHNYNLASRNAMYRFFAKWLLNRDDADTITEGDIKVEKPEDLLVFTDDNLPADILRPAELVAQAKVAARRKIDALRPTSRSRLDELSRVVRFGVKHATCSVLPATGNAPTYSHSNEEGITAAGWQFSYRLYERSRRPVQKQRFVSPAGSPAVSVITICVHPDGVRAKEQVRDLIAEPPSRPTAVLCIEPFGTGSTRPPDNLDKPRGTTKFFTTFNRTDAAETIFDILTVLGAALGNQDTRQVNLVGFGRMGPMCLAARALVPAELTKARGLQTVVDMNGFDIDSDDAYLKQLNLPNMRRIGGLRAVAAVAANGPIWFHNAGEQFDEQWVKGAGEVNGVEVRVTRERADGKAIAGWLADSR